MKSYARLGLTFGLEGWQLEWERSRVWGGRRLFIPLGVNPRRIFTLPSPTPYPKYIARVHPRGVYKLCIGGYRG